MNRALIVLLLVAGCQRAEEKDKDGNVAFGGKEEKEKALPKKALPKGQVDTNLGELLEGLPENARPKNHGDAVRLDRAALWLAKNAEGKSFFIKTAISATVHSGGAGQYFVELKLPHIYIGLSPPGVFDSPRPGGSDLWELIVLDKRAVEHVVRYGTSGIDRQPLSGRVGALSAEKLHDLAESKAFVTITGTIGPPPATKAARSRVPSAVYFDHFNSYLSFMVVVSDIAIDGMRLETQ